MTETIALPADIPAPDQGLVSRAIGVVVAPRRTYGGIVARPRVLGALLLNIAIIAAASLIFYGSQVGQDALLDQQIRVVESFGGQINDEVYERLERQAPYAGYTSAGSVIVLIPLMSLVVAGLAFVMFNAILGGAGTFKQALAVVVHAGFVVTFAQFFVLPLNYIRESISSPTTLAAFFPFLEETTFAARFLGAIDLVYVWWMVILAIGLAVLYKRRTGPIATGLLVLNLVLALIVAAIRSALSGA
jgi:Yip1 domain